MDLKPGGAFSSTMQSPEGQQFPNTGCFLEIVENRKLVWTSALLPGFRPVPPSDKQDMLFTAVVMMEPAGKGTKYTAIAVHRDTKDRDAHKAMGFHEGWGMALDQMIAMIKSS